MKMIKNIENMNLDYWHIGQLLYIVKIARSGDYELHSIRQFTKGENLSGRAYEAIRKTAKI